MTRRWRPMIIKSGLFFVVLLFSSAASGQEGTGDPVVPAEGTGEPVLPSVDEVMDHLDQLWQADSSHSEMSMTVETEEWSRTLDLEGWSLGDDFSLVIIRSPAREAGTASLMTDEGMWSYAPRADRLMRIPSGMLSDSWMGSHFSNDDLMRESDYQDDFDTTLSWVEEDGTTYLLASSITHEDAPIPYTRIDWLMTEDTWVPVRGEYYDDEEIVRTMYFRDVQTISGRPVPMVMELIPHTEPGESTLVQYTLLEFDAEVDEDLFTQRGLRRAAQQR